MENGETGGKAKGKGKDKSGGKGDKGADLPQASGEPQHRCKFFLSDAGCRKGKECSWAHIPDGKKRCYGCGAVDHLAPDCPRRSSTTSTPSPTRPKAAKVTDDKAKEDEQSVSSEGTAANGGEVMQQLLTEANKMLKTLSSREKPATVTHDERMRALQEQLNELKEKTLRTLRLTRITKGGVSGLLDSGATHPMRAVRKNEKYETYKMVEVTLASGKLERLRMSPQGVMVVNGPHAQDVEPIVPMGLLVRKLRCQLHWGEDGLHVWHPKHGYLDIKIESGCPQVSKVLALKLIRELEEVEDNLIQYQSKSLTWETRLQERAWLRSLVDSHPAFVGIPQAIKDKLVVTPEEDLKALPANRRARKIWKRDGCVLHLFAGGSEGYTFARAYKEIGGCSKQVLEIDIQRGEDQNLCRSSCYGSLMRMASDGQISTLIGGPNCRTRSVLRTYPGGPPPVRSWQDGEFGVDGISAEEMEKVQHDDEMMWKLILLYLVAKASKKALRRSPQEQDVGLLIEQPAAPEYKPEVVSFWWTKQWRALQEQEGLWLLNVNQGDYGGEAVKPTGLGTNLDIADGRLKGHGRARPPDGSGDSRSLARWAPGMMRAIAVAIMSRAGKQIHLKAINWEQHLRSGHTPFHRDCRVCQEAAAKDRPHRRVRHPKAGVLSLDIAGPLRPELDHEGEKKYILVGAFTWIVPKGESTEEKTVEVPDDAPTIDPDEVFADEEGGRLPDPEVNSPDEEVLQPGEELCDDQGRPHGEVANGEKDSQEGKDEEGNGGEGEEEFDIEVYRLAIPIESRSAEKVLDAVIQLYLQLRADGFQIQQVHTDKAREFVARGFVAWCRNRNIYRTTTSGDSPQQNGRAERAVQYVKGRVRVLLLSAGWKASRWPLACWYIHAMERLKRNQRKMVVPPFGTEVLVRKRYWKSKELEPTHEKVWYVAPIPEAHGHLVMDVDGALRVAAYTLAATRQPPDSDEAWIAIKTEVEDREDELEIRRRIRGKTAVRTVDVNDTKDDELVWSDAMQKVIEDESVKLIEDDELTGTLVYKRLRSIKQTLPVQPEVEDVLRTRIVSVAEFLRQTEEWRPAVEAEMRQLFEEKRALTHSSLTSIQEMKMAGIEVEVIPSKLVITMKPGPRRKLRIVACGNYVEFKGEELYAAGADSAALRLLLKSAAEGGWNLLTVDVKVAFLNAPLVTSRKDGSEEAQVYALKPPSLLLRLGYAKEDEVWIAEKAMYGLRQSPRSWSLHRDKTLQELSIKGLKLRQTTAEQNLWAIEDDSQQLVGMILIYVDDMLVGGRGDVADAVLQAVQGVWETSEPEKIDDGLMSKFLGMELTKKDGVLKATQTAFIQERLGANLGEDWERMKGHSTPCGREIIEIEEEQDIKPEEVKDAQRIVGELLWLVTRSRLDLMYVTARLAQWVLRAPRTVQRLSKQVWSYLRKTLHQGLLFLPEPGQGWAGESLKGLEAFSDASFAPGGQHSIGAVIVLWNGAPMMWRAGKQPFPTMSAAESELTEATEAMLMGDAFDALLSDVFGNYPKSLLIDNQAAIQLISEESGAWRTRHLRLRANHLRWRISRMDWRVNHCPGERMLADIRTKPLAAQRFEDLKTLCGMSEEKEDAKVTSTMETGTTHAAAPEGLQQALRMITIATLMGTVASQEALQDHEGVRVEEELCDQGGHYYFVAVSLVIFFAVGAVIYEGWIVKSGITCGAERMMKLMILAAMVQPGKAQGSDDEDGGGRRHDDSAALFFLMAAYTFLVVVVVMLFQRFGHALQNLSMTPEERRRREILETQAELQEARERFYRAEERLKRLRDGSEDREEEYTPRSSTRSQHGSSSRRRRSLRDEESEESDRRRVSGEEWLDQDRQEMEGRDRSQSTRSYRSREMSQRGTRFTAFVTQDDRDQSQSEEVDESHEEPPSGPILPEPSGEGIYAEQARRMRRRVHRVPEEDGTERDEHREGDETTGGAMDAVEENDVGLHEEELPGDLQGEENHEQGEEEPADQDPVYSPTSEITPEEEVAQGAHQPEMVVQATEPRGDLAMEPEEEAPSGSGHRDGEDGRDGRRLRDDHGGRRGDPAVLASRPRGPRGPWGPLNPPDPDSADLPNYSVWITPNGRRYHTAMSCPTLAKTRTIAISRWCQACGRIRPERRFSDVYVVSPGLDAHRDMNCRLVGLRTPTLYRCCQRCDRIPVAVVGAQQLADRQQRG